MIEPRDRDWGDRADWSRLPRIEPRIPALLTHFRTEWSPREVLVVEDRRLTYGELEARSAVLARQLLASGVCKGCRVGLILPTDETFLITWMATTRIGGVAVSLSTVSTAAEIRKIIGHADLHMLFASTRCFHHDYVKRIADALPEVAHERAPYSLDDTPHLRSIWFWETPSAPCPAWAEKVDLSHTPQVSPSLLCAAESQIHSSDPAAVIYTSGSTAEPKGVIHSHGSFVRQGMKLAASFKYQNDERAYAPMPFFWVGGLTTTAMCIMTLGATMLVSSKSGSELLDFLERERTTTVVAWPHTLRALAADPSFAKRDWSSMRDGMFFEALPPERRPKDPAMMATPLGMTEVNGPYTIQQRFLTEDQLGSVGPLMCGTEGRLVDPQSGAVLAMWADGDRQADSHGQAGVLQLRSDTMMLGMVKRENADIFTPDGWYHTHDLCSFRKGHLYFEGREDDLIKASGANVSPREVEEVLRKIPGIAAANVYGVLDQERGSVVGAVIVPSPGLRLDAATIRAEAAKFLSGYKVPRVVVVLQASQIPKLSSSKVDRRALIRMLQEAHDRV